MLTTEQKQALYALFCMLVLVSVALVASFSGTRQQTYGINVNQEADNTIKSNQLHHIADERANEIHWWQWDHVEWWHVFGETLGGLATTLGVVLAVGVGLWTIFSARESQKEATAMEAYGGYLQLATNHVDLAEGGIPTGDPKFTQYAWFVSYFLNVCEEILEAKPGDKVWEQSVITEIGPHKIYLCEDRDFNSEELHLYSGKLQNIIKEVCCPKQRRQIWLEPAVVRHLEAMRQPSESYSDVIMRLVEMEGERGRPQ